MSAQLRTIRSVFLWVLPTCLALAGAVFTVALGIQNEFFTTETLERLQPLTPHLPLVYSSLVAISILALFFLILIAAISMVPTTLEVYYTCLNGKGGDIRGVIALAKRRIGGSISGRAAMDMWIAKNPNSLRVLRRHMVFPRGLSISTIRGYYVVLPLKKSACDAYLNQEISGLGIPVEWICSEEEKVHGVYIGGIVGADKLASVNILQRMKRDLFRYVDAGISCLIARGGTPKGIEILKRCGFQKVAENEHGPIYELKVENISSRHMKFIENSDEHV